MAREVKLVLAIRKPWWTFVVLLAVKGWARVGLPVNPDRLSGWLVGHFEITARGQ